MKCIDRLYVLGSETVDTLSTMFKFKIQTNLLSIH